MTTSPELPHNDVSAPPSPAQELFVQEANLRIQRLEEVEQKRREIDKIFETASQTIDNALQQKDLEGETQRELSILYKLIEKVRAHDSVYLARQLRTAVSILTSDTVENIGDVDDLEKNSQTHSKNLAIEDQVTQLNRENEVLRKQIREQKRQIQDLRESAKRLQSGSRFIDHKIVKNFRSFFIIDPNRSKNFFMARRIRREIEYQTSSRGSRSTWLILGLACSFFIIIGLPTLLLYKTRPLTITVRSDMIDNSTGLVLSGGKDFQVMVGKSKLNLFDTLNSTVAPANTTHKLKLLEDQEYSIILEEKLQEGANQISRSLENYFQTTLLNSIHGTVRENFQNEMISVLAIEQDDQRQKLAARIEGYIDRELNDVIDELSSGDNVEEETVNELRFLTENRERNTDFLQNIWIGGVELGASETEEYIAAIQQANPGLFAQEGSPPYLNDLGEVLRKEIANDIGNRSTEAIESLYLKSNSEAGTRTATNTQTNDGQTTSAGEADEQDDWNVTFQSLGLNSRLLIVVVAGGAFGGFAFIVLQVQNPRFYVDQDRFSLFITGLLKPISGVALAIFLYALLKSQISPIALGAELKDDDLTPENRERTTLAYFTISFIAGFSQLFVQDLIARTQNTVSASNTDKRDEQAADSIVPPSSST